MDFWDEIFHLDSAPQGWKLHDVTPIGRMRVTIRGQFEKCNLLPAEVLMNHKESGRCMGTMLNRFVGVTITFNPRSRARTPRRLNYNTIFALLMALFNSAFQSDPPYC